MQGLAENFDGRGCVVRFAEARAAIRLRRAPALSKSGQAELEQAFGRLDDRLIECGAAAASLRSASARPLVEWAGPVLS